MVMGGPLNGWLALGRACGDAFEPSLVNAQELVGATRAAQLAQLAEHLRA